MNANTISDLKHYRTESRTVNCIYYMVALICVTIGVEPSWARPEFALKTGINRCTTCHYSPAGGGPRNLNGKYFGSAGYKLSPLSAQPYAGADVKFLYYQPDKHSDTRGGLATMAGAVWAAIPLSEGESVETRVVGEQNIGGFTSSGPRNLYLQFAQKDETRTSFLPQHFLLGRFIPPFGVMTDEHRNYVRMQTGSTWNRDVRMGVLLGANPFSAFHYDVAAMNYNSGSSDGTNYQNGQATQWAYLANFRLMPARWGVLFGFSAAFYEADVGGTSRSARSMYAGFDFGRWTAGWVPVTVFLEHARAANWNSSFSSTFVSDTAYQTAIASTSSNGYMVHVNYDITPKVQLNYRYDGLMLDREYPADIYQRHGFGVKHYFGPNMWFQMRYENAMAARPGEEAGTKIGGLNAFWTVVSVGI